MSTGKSYGASHRLVLRDHMRHIHTMRLFLILLAVFLLPVAASAQSVIRDAEIESDLRSIGSPIFDAAGLNPAQVKIIVINDDVINAFVAGGQNLFLYTGLFFELKSVGELAGVIAHESGHMAGGHLIRMKAAAERASMESMAATILGVAVGVGAGDAGAGVATALGGGEYANRTMLRNSRVFESSADQAGMAALDRAGYSARGMASFLDRLQSQEVLPELQRSGYALTHPLSRERLASVQSFLSRSRNADKPFPAAWEDDFQRIRAKLLAFTDPAQAMNVYRNDLSVAGRYGMLIAQYRTGHIPESLNLLATLQKAEPRNGYFDELQGQILMEQGRIDDAIVAYRAAIKNLPDAALIHLALAQALLQDEKRNPDEAIAHLLTARDNGENDSPGVYRWLAIGYGRKGLEGMAKLSLAEEALLKRDTNFAITQARLAETLLASDPVAVQRARDIQSAAARVRRDKDKD